MRCLKSFQRNLVFHALLVCSVLVVQTPGLCAAIMHQELGNRGAPAGGESTFAAYDRDRVIHDISMVYYQLEQLRQRLDKQEFDPAAKAAAIGPRIEALFEFVRDEISYEPYSGVLRTGAGALMSRAGNAFDQALLLADLLEYHGYQVRFARAALSPAAARQVIRSVLSADRRPPLGTESAESAQLGYRHLGMQSEEARAIWNADQLRRRQFRAELSGMFAFDHQLVTSQVRQSGIAGDPTPLTGEIEKWVQAAGDHCWLQVLRDGAWIDLDPVIAGHRPSDRLREPDETLDALPLQLTHQLHFTVTLERREGETIASETVLDRNIALLDPITHIELLLAPLQERAEQPTGILDPELLKSFEVAAPILVVNGRPQAGTPFNLNGRLENQSADDAFSKGGSALDGLFGGGPAATPGASRLERVVLSVESSGPGGAGSRTTRTIATRPDGHETGDTEGDASLRLQFLGKFEMLATGSRIPAEYVTALQLEFLNSTRNTVVEVCNSHWRDREGALAAVGSLRSYPFSILDLMTLRGELMELNTARYFPGVTSYFGEPQLAAFRTGLDLLRPEEPVLVSEIDILLNRVEAMACVDGAWDTTDTVEVRMQQGIVDTLLEYQLLGGGDVQNTHSVMHAATEAGQSVQLIATADDPRLASLDIDRETREAINRDLKQGYVVVLPERPVRLADKVAFAWWRVDADLGHTLGMGGLGAGQAMTEYLKTGSLWIAQKFVLIVPLILISAIATVGIMFVMWVLGKGSFDPTTAEFWKALAMGTIMGVVIGLLLGKLAAGLTVAWARAIVSKVPKLADKQLQALAAESATVTAGGGSRVLAGGGGVVGGAAAVRGAAGRSSAASRPSGSQAAGPTRPAAASAQPRFARSSPPPGDARPPTWRLPPSELRGGPADSRTSTVIDSPFRGRFHPRETEHTPRLDSSGAKATSNRTGNPPHPQEVTTERFNAFLEREFGRQPFAGAEKAVTLGKWQGMSASQRRATYDAVQRLRAADPSTPPERQFHMATMQSTPNLQPPEILGRVIIESNFAHGKPSLDQVARAAGVTPRRMHQILQEQARQLSPNLRVAIDPQQRIQVVRNSSDGTAAPPGSDPGPPGGGSSPSSATSGDSRGGFKTERLPPGEVRSVSKKGPESSGPPGNRVETPLASDADKSSRLPSISLRPPRSSNAAEGSSRIPPEQRPSYLPERKALLHDVIDAHFRGKEPPPLHVTNEQGLKEIIRTRTLQQPNRGGASFSPKKMGTLREGPIAIRVKPESEKYIEWVDHTGGKVFRFWESGKVGEGKFKSYIPKEHLQVFRPGKNANEEHWADIPSQAGTTDR